ncbi:hypothetical protein BB559_000700 [Furculomyces boomerangus]|uniref:Uncharacterized protein n=1 Tax=Furculomyces boomerangus TaxID=61424 RepID=A0A2T9YE25_9FUNG|nr:hypothetical protein BB559_004528 [Furculomyces boomerangus]PVU99460.1 hypothetical protein BB559_000700 [Furculomyces boomerangus]
MDSEHVQPDTSSEDKSSTTEASFPTAALGSFIGKVGDAFGNLQKVIVDNEKRTLEMVSAMNSMMETTLKMGISSSLQVETFSVEKLKELSSQNTNDIDCSLVKLIVLVKNNTKIPIENTTIELGFTSSPNNKIKLYNIDNQEKNLTDSNVDIEKSLVWKESNQDGYKVYIDGVCLVPFTEVRTSIVLGIKNKEQIKSQFKVKFLSPGTGSEICINNSFYLYILYQYKRTYIPLNEINNSLSSKKEELIQKVKAMVLAQNAEKFQAKLDTLRKVFFVPPALGVEIGSYCIFESLEHGIFGFRIERVDDNYLGECVWLTSEETSDDGIDFDSISKEIVSSA